MKRTIRWKLGLALVTAASFTGCFNHESVKLPSRNTASADVQPPLELGERWDSSNDAQTDDVIATNERMLIERSKDESYIHRDAHPKHHGCVKAFVEVDASALSSDLRVGIFAAKSSFPAWIRFSNGNPDGVHSPDADKDIRGMAIKLMNVQGSPSGSQDFVMLTSKEFFSEDADDYVELHRALSNKASLFWYLGTHWKQAGILLHGQIKAPNPLQVEYFSSVPYKLGTRSMKFKALPCATGALHDEMPDEPSPNFLRERLVSSLKSTSACYELFVQPNMDPDANPVENPMIAWDEAVSPYVRVATLHIPQQSEIDSDAHLNFCENLSFSPWHTLPETRPLGQINRMRRKIYSSISEVRHRANHIPQVEPRSHEICTGETAPLCLAPKL